MEHTCIHIYTDTGAKGDEAYKKPPVYSTSLSSLREVYSVFTPSPQSQKYLLCKSQQVLPAVAPVAKAPFPLKTVLIGFIEQCTEDSSSLPAVYIEGLSYYRTSHLLDNWSGISSSVGEEKPPRSSHQETDNNRGA